MRGNCQLCEKYSEELEGMLYSNGDKLMVCPECFDDETARGDMEYERWKDEQGSLESEDKDV